jgi:murein DD-endopeptidase MepM/ murein hydrolase activator NlpD
MTRIMAQPTQKFSDAGASGRRASLVPHAFGILVIALVALAGCNMGGRPQGSTPPPQPTVAAPVTGPADVPSGTYVVVGGDTVHAVANRFGVPIRSLIELNNLQPPYQLTPGQTLQIPTQRVHIVAAGDTISGIAQQYGVDASTLVRQNDIAEPYTIYVGQTLVLPGQIEPVSLASAPVVVETLPAVPSSSGTITSEELPPPVDPAATVPEVEPSAGEPTTTVVVPTPSGSTAGLEPPPVLLPGVPTSTSSSSSSTAEPPPAKPGSNEPFDATEIANDTTAPTAPNDATAPPASASNVPPTEPAAPAATPSVPVETVPPPVAATGDTPTETQTAAVDPMLIEPAARDDQTFLWPVTGKVVSEFGPLSDGLHNDGINIAAPVGTPVRAAENGVVVYAGNELRGFGNMLLIRHADGFVTAYAHNESLLVARGDTVERGQIIARVGSSGSVDSPQLHFEIRVGTDAVDPREYLGSSGA